MAISYSGSPDEIVEAVRAECPEVDEVLDRVRARVPYIKREIVRHEAAVVYRLARDYDGGRVLEIGTAWGYSAAVMAEAAPGAEVVTLNPKPSEYKRAVQYLLPYENVIPLMEYSWNYLKADRVRAWDMVFVDGDHDQVKRDLAWWKRVNAGGLMLFHDYSPAGSWRPCRQVYDTLNSWLAESGRETWDVLVADDRGVGMAGLVK